MSLLKSHHRSLGLLDPTLILLDLMLHALMPSVALEVISHVLLVTIGLRNPHRMRREVPFYFVCWPRGSSSSWCKTQQEKPLLMSRYVDYVSMCFCNVTDGRIGTAVNVSVTEISEQYVPCTVTSVHLPESDIFEVLRNQLIVTIVTSSGSPSLEWRTRRLKKAVGGLCKANNLLFKVFSVRSFGGVL